MRWVWRYADYVAREDLGALQLAVLPWLIEPLRRWDLRRRDAARLLHRQFGQTSPRAFARCYGRSSVVIPPPIELSTAFDMRRSRTTSICRVARLVAYKRIDLAIDACNLLKRRLAVIGDGPDRARLEALAGPTVTLPRPTARRGGHRAPRRLPGAALSGRRGLRHGAARGQRLGRPVVAWRGGGALDTCASTRPASSSPSRRSTRWPTPWNGSRRGLGPGGDARARCDVRSPGVRGRIRGFLRSVAPTRQTERTLAALNA